MIALCLYACSAAGSPPATPQTNGAAVSPARTNTKTTFKSFTFPGAYPVAIAPDAKGNIWFALCSHINEGPCRIGYFDPTLKQTLIVGTVPNVVNLTLGPDANMWFDQGRSFKRGYYLGKIDGKGKIGKFHLPGWQMGIVGGPDGRLWFVDNGALASVKTDGTGFQKTTAVVWNETAPLVFGPDKRLYFEKYTSSANYPMCALTTKTGKLQCFAKPSGGEGAWPLLWVGNILLAEPYRSGAVFAMSPSGKQWSLQGGTQFVPGVLMRNGGLGGVSANVTTNDLLLAQLGKTSFQSVKRFALPANCNGQIQTMVTTTDGYLWVNAGSVCLARFQIKQ